MTWKGQKTHCLHTISKTFFRQSKDLSGNVTWEIRIISLSKRLRWGYAIAEIQANCLRLRTARCTWPFGEWKFPDRPYGKMMGRLAWQFRYAGKPREYHRWIYIIYHQKISYESAWTKYEKINKIDAKVWLKTSYPKSRTSCWGEAPMQQPGLNQKQWQRQKLDERLQEELCLQIPKRDHLRICTIKTTYIMESDSL